MTRLFVALCLALGTILAIGASPASAKGLPPLMLGPGDAGVHDVKDKAIIRMSKFGFVYIAGQQHSHLTVKYVEKTDSLRYRDTRTKHASRIAKGCHREKVKKGISVVCKIPKKFNHRKMFVQVWPRLGNDFVDGHTLPARFRLWVLADAGNDIVKCGKGADFVNGAKGNDRVWGGPGNDWLRTGPGRDYINGGPGKDRIAPG
ncbi:MAG: hypothetical protein QM714_08100 [Nocardioides sp.]|uniref:calcium-binding protein n=1 Tax=Nocardioides sp. TaxID=35761 RepID=UPI0039E45038